MAGEFVVQFVLLEGEDQNQMQRAEEAIRTTAKLPSQVINGPAALEISKAQKNALVVCDPFEGEVYQHLKALKCRIVGPQCVLSCMKLGKAIPKADYPIYNIAMRNVVISCSSMDKKERDTIHELVQLMGGHVVKAFTGMVTHLVAGEVGSKKYHVAVKLGKPIMLPEWIRACWEQGKTRHIDATDEEFQDYKCPVFQGIVVCVTGLDSVDRQEIRTQVEQYGGRYSGELRMKECTHLVAKEPKGAKYEFARKWKLHCVTTRWFFESLEAGVCQDENLYRLDRTNSTEDNKTSTPSQLHCAHVHEKKAPRLSSIGDISTISTASNNMSHVNDTNLNATRLSMRDHDVTLLAADLDTVDVSNIDAGMFLDGCTIFLSGFIGARLEKLRKIVNAGGGMRFNQLNEKVSHVVMGGPDEQVAQTLSAENLRPHVVSAKWLVECVKAGKQVPEEPFYCLELPPLDPTSPVQPKKTEKPEKPPPPSIEPEDEDVTQMEEAEPAEDDIMSQYLGGAEEEEDNTTIEAPQERQEPTEEEEEDEVVFMKLEKRPEDEDEDDNDVTVAMDGDCETEIEEEGGGGVFQGKLFSFFSFTEQQTATLAELVGENGGSVVKSGSRSVPNYAVVPVLGFPEGISAEEIVTDCWLNVCLEQESLLRPEHNPLFTPLTFKPDCMPLVGCVLSLSQYAGVEREFLSGLAEELGACCQEFFVKKAQPSKNLQASTHLLCKTPEGSKYQAAKKWKLPAVTSDWIFECGRTGKKVSEERFLVSNIQQPQEPTQDKPDKITKAEHHESRPKETKLDVTPSETPGPSKESPGNKENRQEDRRTSTVPKPQPPVPSTSVQKKSPPAEKQVKSPLEKDDRTCKTKTTAQKSSEPPISKEQDSRKDTSAPQVIPKNKTPVLSKEPLVAKNKTPVLSKELQSVKKNKRLTELQQSQVKIDTPSKFLSKGVVFKPSFDMQDAFDALQSPAVVGNQGQRKRARRSSVPLDALLQQNLEKALSNFSKEGQQAGLGPGIPQGEQEQEEQEEEEEVFTKEPSPPRPLAGVVIYVSKKLSKQQSDYNDLACSLGADYRWTYDESVTHFIFQGRANDTTKEFRTARSQGKTIVSPHWLQVCEEQEARVDETLFPHTYNPKLSLSQAVVSKTPARSTRSSSRRKDSEQQENQDSTEGEEDREQDRTHMDQGGTLEMREDFQRQFEEIMSATRVTRSSRRRTKRLNDSTGTPSASDDSAKRFSTRSRTRAPSQTSKADSKDQEQAKNSAKCPENFTEASQSIQITWDDPTGRQERERIAEQLRYRASPTQEMEELAQDGQDFLTRMSGESTNQEQEPAQMRLPSANNRASSTSPNQGADRSFGEDEPTPTPEGPSIAFPFVNPAVPHPTTVTRAEGEEEEEVQKQVYIFQMSGMTPQEKMDYSGLIEELGGEVIDKQTFDPRCTHIVVGNPNRNEKYLSALAMGRWILHRSYMEACREAKAFVEEDPHEWGTATDVSGLPENVARLALAARRWRQNLADLRARNNDPDINAFQNWTVLLHVDQSRTSGFKRLLESGGARVLSTRPPHGNIHEATHAFIEIKGKGVDPSLDIQALVQAGVWCLKSEYIADYLMQDPIPKPQNFVISEALPYMTGAETPRKRKASSTSGLDGKRSKRL